MTQITQDIYFYLSYLVSKNKLSEAKEIVSKIDYINSTLLLSQGKNWFDNTNFEKFKEVFSCQKPDHVISEFLFLISNLYSSQDNFEKSNFYLYLSNFLNPKFKYNLSLVAENYYFNEDYKKSKKILKILKMTIYFIIGIELKKKLKLLQNKK